MTRERWQRVKSLFERALEQPPSLRDDILDDSDESPSVVAEVRELISRDAVAGSFLADAVSAESSIATLLSSSDLVSGHFRIVSLLGRGGMGVVYRADDLVLSRPVALKFLPGGLGGTPQALERLRREARAAAALNHPNICVVYETGKHQGQPFIAMELLEGHTLKQSIGAKPLKTEELLDWAVQIANGLDAAHRNGIVHRDIKPANIFITKFGQVKILDFGLAKVAAPVSEGGAEFTAPPTEEYLTNPGMVIGTVPYMSPEQARGEQLDARTDLFSFGAVLYEMATGRSAFAGATTALIHQAVLGLTPPPASTANPSVPPELDRIVGKALEKDRELRYQYAADMHADLKRLKRDSESVRPPAVSTPWARRWSWIGAAALILIALGFGWFWFNRQRLEPRPMLTERQLTHNTPENHAIGGEISPDGKHLAYADTRGLHLSVIDTGEVHDISLPEEIQTHLWNASWFPDGEKLLLTAEGTTDGMVIWAQSVFGGAPRKLRVNSRAAVVSPQGTLIAFTTRQLRDIWVMGPNGENPRRVVSSESERFVTLAWAPTGQRLAYLSRSPDTNGFGGAVRTVALDGGAPTLVFEDARLHTESFSTLRWVRDGRLLFALQGHPGSEEANLWEITADPQTGKAAGKPQKITNWYGVTPLAASVSEDGSRLAVSKLRNRDDVYVSELTEKGTRIGVPRRLTFSDSRDFPCNWTPDSKAILLQSNRTGKFQIYRQLTDQQTAAPLIPASDEETTPKLTPGGSWILYWANPLGTAQATTARLMRLPAAGGSPELILEAPMDETPSFDCPSHPDSACVFSRSEQGHRSYYVLDPVEGLGKALGKSQGDDLFAISPDGVRIAVTSVDKLGQQAHILDLRNGTERIFPLPPYRHIWSLAWAADGKALFAAVQSGEYFIVQMELDGTIRELLNRGRDHWLGFASPSPDGRQLAFAQQTYESNFWLLENF